MFELIIAYIYLVFMFMVTAILNEIVGAVFSLVGIMALTIKCLYVLTKKKKGE